MNIKDRYNCAYFFLESHRNVEKVLIKTVAIIAHKQSKNRLRVETVASPGIQLWLLFKKTKDGKIQFGTVAHEIKVLQIISIQL